MRGAATRAGAIYAESMAFSSGSMTIKESMAGLDGGRGAWSLSGDFKRSGTQSVQFWAEGSLSQRLRDFWGQIQPLAQRSKS